MSHIANALLNARRKGLDDTAIEKMIWESFGIKCAVLVIDSSGMTRHCRKYGIVEFFDHYIRMCELVEGVFTFNGCFSWRCFADNVFAEFKNVDKALSAANQIHRALEKNTNLIAGVDPYRVCIGIGYGPVIDNGRWGKFGDEMNLAARLGEDVAGAGETILTESAFNDLTFRDAISVESKTLQDGTPYKVIKR